MRSGKEGRDEAGPPKDEDEDEEEEDEDEGASKREGRFCPAICGIIACPGDAPGCTGKGTGMGIG
jgi:hypothetical protein